MGVKCHILFSSSMYITFLFLTWNDWNRFLGSLKSKMLSQIVFKNSLSFLIEIGKCVLKILVGIYESLCMFNCGSEYDKFPVAKTSPFLHWRMKSGAFPKNLVHFSLFYFVSEMQFWGMFNFVPTWSKFVLFLLNIWPDNFDNFPVFSCMQEIW